MDRENPGLVVAIIGPDEWYQEQAFHPLSLSIHVASQIPYYPALDQVSIIASNGHNVFIIDLDSDPEIALKLVERFSQIPNTVVMAMAKNPSKNLIVRCMQSGAREILLLPFALGVLDEAMARAQSRVYPPQVKNLGRLCVFLGSKGGSGTTTIASNFAIAVALASEKRVLLIDFDLPLGDAVLGFGMHVSFSTKDALESYRRLDATLLKNYVIRHASGLSILPAPGKYVPCQVTREAIDRLVLVARQEFDFVILDAGTRFDLVDTAIFHPDAQIYLVSQASTTDLRNANRILSLFASGAKAPKVQLVLNRHSSAAALDEEQVAKALPESIRWRIPNNFKAVRDMQNTGVPIAMKDSPFTDSIWEIAKAGLDLPGRPARKKKMLGLFSRMPQPLSITPKL